MTPPFGTGLLNPAIRRVRDFGRWLDALPPIHRFTLLIGGAFLVGALVIAATVAAIVERFATQEEANAIAREFGDYFPDLLGPQVLKGGAPLPSDTAAARKFLDAADVLRLALYRADGTVAFATTLGLIGQPGFAGADASGVRRALGGEVTFVLKESRDGAPILGVWVPLVGPAGVAGVAEIERPAEHLVASLRRIQLLTSSMIVLGSLVLFVSLQRLFADSTERLRAREEAERAAQVQVAALGELTRLKDEFVARASHELRSPLAPIFGFAVLLSDGAATEPEDVVKYGKVILRQAEMLDRLVADLLEMGRLESGRYRIEARPVQLAELIEGQTRAIAGQSPNHRFETDAVPDLPAALADPDRVTQVVTNLLTNAVRYSPEGGAIRVATRRLGDTLVVSVADQGVGIPADRVGRIFEKFYRVDDPRTKGVRGSGLGLAITRELVEAQGGQIWVESTPGVGSTFSFSLPLAPAPSPASEPVLTSSSASAP